MEEETFPLYHYRNPLACSNNIPIALKKPQPHTQTPQYQKMILCLSDILHLNINNRTAHIHRQYAINIKRAHETLVVAGDKSHTDIAINRALLRALSTRHVTGVFITEEAVPWMREEIERGCLDGSHSSQESDYDAITVHDEDGWD
jgi:hypothetical protein